MDNWLKQMSDEYEPIEAQYDIFTGIWKEIEALRSKGGFEDAAKKIKCPVIAIHGDYDPHPADGVKKILSEADDFTFYLLEKCGHYPWLEKHAKEKFYSILLSITASTDNRLI
jgi:pimeloyl-ACP methyl ester carboxylesterase